MIYRFIQRHRREYSVLRMCQVLAVSSSGFYAWLQRGESAGASTRMRNCCSGFASSSTNTAGGMAAHASGRIAGDGMAGQS